MEEAVKTKTVPVCQDCDKDISKPEDGVHLYGMIEPLTKPFDANFIDHNQDIALCKPCLCKRLVIPMIASRG